MTSSYFVTQLLLLFLCTAITVASIYIIARALNHFFINVHQPSATTPHHKPCKSASSQSASNKAISSSSNIATNSQDAQKELPFFRNTILSCLSFFLIQIIAINIDHITSIVFSPDPLYVPCIILVWSFYFLGRMVLTLIFIGRLIGTFDGTPFKYSKCAINSLKTVWYSMVVYAICGGLISSTIMPILGRFIGISFLAIDMILSFTLLYMYLRKLFTLTKATKDTVLMRTITKYAVLYTICYTSTIVTFICMGISTVLPIIIKVESDKIRTAHRNVLLLSGVDAFLNSLCLWLQLSSARSTYIKICQCIHNRFELCCHRCTQTLEDEKITFKEDIGRTTDTVCKATHIAIHSENNIAIIL